jgi:hypothetical protein
MEVSRTAYFNAIKKHFFRLESLLKKKKVRKGDVVTLIL